MKIKYRRLLPGESRMYREVRLESLKSFPTAYISSFEEENETEKLSFESSIEAASFEKFVVGAFVDETLAGICGFFQEDQKKTRHRGAIVQMYVKPEYKGLKIGRNLLNATIEEAMKLPEIEQIILGVEANNKSANRIYEEAGFQEYGFVKGYFKVNSEYYDQRLMILYLHRDNY